MADEEKTETTESDPGGGGGDPGAAEETLTVEAEAAHAAEEHRRRGDTGGREPRRLRPRSPPRPRSLLPRLSRRRPPTGAAAPAEPAAEPVAEACRPRAAVRSRRRSASGCRGPQRPQKTRPERELAARAEADRRGCRSLSTTAAAARSAAASSSRDAMDKTIVVKRRVDHARTRSTRR